MPECPSGPHSHPKFDAVRTDHQQPHPHPLAREVDGFYRKAGLTPAQTVAVAFSGGADSVALLATTRMAGYRCVALHCNFHLRGDESDRDEIFAREMADRLGCEFRIVHFDVAAHRALTGESVEMACRSLRYRWFGEEFSKAHGEWKCIALGHHADDNTETFFLNLMRGTGIRGLTGIPEKRDIFVRPMLEVSKAEILDFIKTEGLAYVTDSTNLSSEYRRNSLRNEILPLLGRHFPMMSKNVATTMRNLKRDASLLDSLIEMQAAGCTGPDGSIRLKSIPDTPQRATLLFHLLNRSGIGTFSHAEAEAILRSENESGLRFHAASGNACFLLNRGVLIPLAEDAAYNATGSLFPVSIDWTEAFTGPKEFPVPGITLEITGRDRFNPSRDASVLWLDAGALPRHTPLTARRWHAGDRIRPFGMHGSRLVSDIYSDAKLSVKEKENRWLLCSGEKILWLPGMRTSAHFAINNSTETILKIMLTSSVNGNINKF